MDRREKKKLLPRGCNKEKKAKKAREACPRPRSDSEQQHKQKKKKKSNKNYDDDDDDDVRSGGGSGGAGKTPAARAHTPVVGGSSSMPKDSVAQQNRKIQEAMGVSAKDALWAVRIKRKREKKFRCFFFWRKRVEKMH